MHPLQLILRDILIASRIDPSEFQDAELFERLVFMADLMKYALIIVSSAPVIAVYPFVQKYFIKGVMIGSLKG